MDVRRWVAPFFFVLAVALLPWTVWLTETLPARHTTEHWDLAWGGLDFAEAAALLLVAITALRRSIWLEAAAAAAGTLLLCDAWFDVLLEHGSRFWLAVAQALVAELPLAIVCFWIARDAERFARHSLPAAFGGPPAAG
jgi:hypothetical protein